MNMSVEEQAYKLYQEGKSYSQIAKELGVSKATAYRYVRKYLKSQENISTQNTEKNVSETVQETSETPKTLETPEPMNAETTIALRQRPPEEIPSSLKNFVDTSNSNIQVADVNDIINNIQNNIVEVPDKSVEKQKEVKESVSDKIKRNTNLILVAIAIVGVIAAIAGIYTYFRYRQTTTESKFNTKTIDEERIEERDEKPKGKYVMGKRVAEL